MTAHAYKKNKNPYLWAMALGAGLFLLLQMVANRLLARERVIPTPSSLMSQRLPYSSSSTLVRPVDLFHDEFFSSPFMIDSGLAKLKQEMDREMQESERQFNSQFMSDVSGFSPLLRRGEANKPAVSSLWGKYDIQEDDNEVTVSVSVPDGVRPEDINIEVLDGDVLHISGGRKMEKSGAKTEMRFEKQFALGRNMEQDKIAAKLKGGRLTITTPKAGHFKEKKVRKIPIKEEL